MTYLVVNAVSNLARICVSYTSRGWRDGEIISLLAGQSAVQLALGSRQSARDGPARCTYGGRGEAASALLANYSVAG
jgi:hypothetical protein